MSLSIDSAGCGLEVQAMLQKKILEFQTDNATQLIEGTAQAQDAIKQQQKGISSAGRVDLLA